MLRCLSSHDDLKTENLIQLNLQLPFRKLAVKRKTCRNILKVRRTARNIIEKGSPLTDKFLEAFENIEDIIDDINSILFAG